MTIEEILTKTGQTKESVLIEHIVMTGLAKLSRYEAQCIYFEKKYNETLEKFQERMSQEGSEDFINEDDLMDWEFADAAFKWWKGQLEAIKACCLIFLSLNVPLSSHGLLMNSRVQDRTIKLRGRLFLTIRVLCILNKLFLEIPNLNTLITGKKRMVT